MTCWETFNAYAFRSIGIGENLLPKSDFTLCQQFTLIGSGLIWNVYFGALALLFGFFLATGIALAKSARSPWLSKPAEWFVFIFRGSPLFIQFFLAYEALQMLPKAGIDVFGISVDTAWTTRAWAGALFVLFLNTSAYAAEIFHGALRSIPKGDLEAAEAYGITGWQKFTRIQWPTMLRLAWPSYTNEAIFLFHATTLVFFSGFPAFRQMGDALYYANYFADKTFNPFVPYPIVAFYFICLTLLLTSGFNAVNRRLNRHLPSNQTSRIRLRPNLIR
ncbi:MAG: ABC transporter permease subunit [Tabrizicola sp.]|uniref:ABC transporter permease n=1 Tax=Tabrizicola sp. TaxID=2005166 RepID=UPI002733EDBD|nr:ABC transporter permease subunit [Tabrizicola sp.]MDP3263737.1 ABC transporter permease subunit [Tabrizicola sp.]MDP3647101.1 ABC transporter permease subunit [Paracoccaceae bacterium]MDZ4066755.1 ABC transporter permease subunit [Tabrizicola sp.]